MMAAVLMSLFWFQGGEFPGLALLWQPAALALLYISGQVFIMSAVSYGDVSVATPVASSKVVIVTFLCAILMEARPNAVTWIAAGLALIGVLCINLGVPKSGRAKVLFTIVLALGAALSFALFDISLQSWAGNWGSGRLNPITFWFVAVFSLGLLPRCTLNLETLRDDHWKSLLVAGALFATQAGFLVFAVSVYGDVARVNVIYALRGLWGVLFAWCFAKWFGGNEATLAVPVMLTRLAGAIFLVAAVVIVIASSYDSDQVNTGPTMTNNQDKKNGDAGNIGPDHPFYRLLSTKYDDDLEDQALEILNEHPEIATMKWPGPDEKGQPFVKDATALHYAANDGKIRLMKRLIELGADVNANEANWYRSVLSWAANNAELEAIQLLLDHGADPKSLNAVHAAAYGGSDCGAEEGDRYVEAIKLLVAAGADINDTRFHDQWTPLRVARDSGNKKAIEYLESVNAKE